MPPLFSILHDKMNLSKGFIENE